MRYVDRIPDLLAGDDDPGGDRGRLLDREVRLHDRHVRVVAVVEDRSVIVLVEGLDPVFQNCAVLVAVNVLDDGAEVDPHQPVPGEVAQVPYDGVSGDVFSPTRTFGIETVKTVISEPGGKGVLDPGVVVLFARAPVLHLDGEVRKPADRLHDLGVLGYVYPGGVGGVLVPAVDAAVLAGARGVDVIHQASSAGGTCGDLPDPVPADPQGQVRPFDGGVPALRHVPVRLDDGDVEKAVADHVQNRHVIGGAVAGVGEGDRPRRQPAHRLVQRRLLDVQDRQLRGDRLGEVI